MDELLKRGWSVRYDENAKLFYAKHPKTGNVAQGETLDGLVAVVNRFENPSRIPR